jgi:hypothetical protein
MLMNHIYFKSIVENKWRNTYNESKRFKDSMIGCALTYNNIDKLYRLVEFNHKFNTLNSN